MKFYSISAASHETGIHASSLRRWESMVLIVPERILMGNNSVRVYTDDQVNALKKVQELIGSGVQLWTAFEWVGGNADE